MSQAPTQSPALREALARAPDPERATRLAERVLEAAGSVPGRALEAHAVGLARALYACCGVAPFLAPWLASRPDWLLALARDELRAPLSREAIDADLAAALAGARDADAARVLREAKYRALARIVTRDCAEEIVPLARSGETLTELTALAEALLEAALRIARARVEARLGPPLWSGPDGAPRLGRFCVLGLGKLGGEELNFSSDVDLVYVYGAGGEGAAGAGPQERAPADYWTRVTQELSALVASETQQRFLYRIDLDLRPEGELGPPVVSEEALVAYYETAADHWEKVAFMKARPVAGDLELGWRAVRAVAPMIYQASMDYAGVQRIRSLKDEIGRRRGARGEGFDVKLDAGGIRDVEFVAQAMQLLHGGRILQLRDRSTQRTLQRLAEVKLLPADEAEALLDAYRFLRRLENRLQMEEERQVHRLPERPEPLLRLARAVGYREDDASERFGAALAARRERVLAFAARFRAESGAEDVAQLFLRHQPALLAASASRPMMESLARAFAREIAASADPALAMTNLDRFVEGVGPRRFYYELLLDRPELVGRLAALFAGSRWLSSTLARHPRLIEPLFADPDLLLLDRAQLREDLAALRRERAGAAGRADYEAELEALRLFVHRQVMNVGLLDLAEKVPRAACEGALTTVAEVALEAALEVARREVERVRPPGPGAGAARFL
ncbi:MAG TPA: hypothetical protein VLC53_02880, partial [Myxococcota bacterium]|nr:hypothetical protein [Myxococcota bacterium]